LVRVGQLINSSLDLREVFQRAAEEVHRLTGCDRVSLVRVEDREGVRHGFALEFSRCREPSGTPPQARLGSPGLQGEAAWIEIPRQPLHDSAAAWVLQHRRTRINRRLDQARPFAEDRSLFDQGFRAHVYLPLVCRNEGVAVLGLATRDEQQLDRWDLGLLREVSGLLATAVDNAAAYSQIAHLKARLEEENVRLREEIRTRQGSVELIGESRAMQEVRRAINQVAGTDSTVLIQGETGTGKELIARLIHEKSPRREQLLVAVNCAALAPGVLTSELFGHEAGAFTGASKRRLGRFELANRGSIFLDEIGDVPAETQVLLLRVLQERVLERVGGSEQIPVDVRVLAATNRDLTAALHEGRFRSDLFYRLNVFPIRVPPLRERRDDIPLLLEHFIARFDEHMNKPIAAVGQRTLDLVQEYDWPGNVRELENLVERAMIVCPGDTLEIEPSWLAAPGPHAHHVPVPAVAPAPAPSLAERERQAILDALRHSGGKIYGPGGAAERLGLKPTTLYGKMRKHHIRKQSGSAQFG
jgi:formate hydrogenlyase transcriptional activator